MVSAAQSGDDVQRRQSNKAPHHSEMLCSWGQSRLGSVSCNQILRHTSQTITRLDARAPLNANSFVTCRDKNKQPGSILWVSNGFFFSPSDRTFHIFSSFILLIWLAKAQINGFARHNIEIIAACCGEGMTGAKGR